VRATTKVVFGEHRIRFRSSFIPSRLSRVRVPSPAPPPHVRSGGSTRDPAPPPAPRRPHADDHCEALTRDPAHDAAMHAGATCTSPTRWSAQGRRIWSSRTRVPRPTTSCGRSPRPRAFSIVSAPSAASPRTTSTGREHLIPWPWMRCHARGMDRRHRLRHGCRRLRARCSPRLRLGRLGGHALRGDASSPCIRARASAFIRRGAQVMDSTTWPRLPRTSDLCAHGGSAASGCMRAHAQL